MDTNHLDPRSHFEDLFAQLLRAFNREEELRTGDAPDELLFENRARLEMLRSELSRARRLIEANTQEGGPRRRDHDS